MRPPRGGEGSLDERNPGSIGGAQGQDNTRVAGALGRALRSASASPRPALPRGAAGLSMPGVDARRLVRPRSSQAQHGGRSGGAESGATRRVEAFAAGNRTSPDMAE